MLNVVAIMGRFARDPTLAQTPSGENYMKFSLACSRSFVAPNQERVVDWIDCVAWKKTAEFISKFFKQGDAIIVDGRLETRTYEDKQGNKRKAYTVVAENVNFAGSKNEANSESKNDNFLDDSADEDLPF